VLIEDNADVIAQQRGDLRDGRVLTGARRRDRRRTDLKPVVWVQKDQAATRDGLPGTLEPCGALGHSLVGCSVPIGDSLRKEGSTSREDAGSLDQAYVELILAAELALDLPHAHEQVRVEVLPSILR
jgi:hypothetical protein